MRVLSSFLLAASLLYPIQSAAPDQVTDSVAFTSTTFWLRAAPSLDAQRVALLPQGTQVQISECAQQSCRVSFRRLVGYLPQEILQRWVPAQPVDAGRGYVNSRGQWIPSPTHTVDGRPPAGASAHCRDGSYSFSQSRSGTCSWHGGVAEWM
jgi:Protein of unknown function (DUF3761)